ncbi:MAG: MarR family transcriptional regulator, partial [Mycobacteriales bacterium]
MSKTKTPNPKQAILEVLETAAQATVAQIAVSAGVGRSTASKVLGQLESDGEVHRTEGGRDGNRRKPDLWSLAAKKPARETGKAPTADKPAGGKSEPTASASAPEGGKLKPNQLNPLVLGYLKDNAEKGPHGPTEIAKALQRSS